RAASGALVELDVQLLERTEDRPRYLDEVVLARCKADVRQAVEQHFPRALLLQPAERRAGAEVLALAESHVVVGFLARQIDHVRGGVLARVSVGSYVALMQVSAFGNFHTMQLKRFFGDPQ